MSDREAMKEALRLLTKCAGVSRLWQVTDACDILRTHLAAPRPEPESKTPAWWMDGLTATLMREGVNKHRAREIAVGYWEAYCQIPGTEEDKT